MSLRTCRERKQRAANQGFRHGQLVCVLRELLSSLDRSFPSLRRQFWRGALASEHAFDLRQPPRNCRFSRILRTMSESKYSIHDLSRFTVEGADNRARFNMPLELGMAFALRSERESSSPQHNWFVLVPEGCGN